MMQSEIRIGCTRGVILGDIIGDILGILLGLQALTARIRDDDYFTDHDGTFYLDGANVGTIRIRMKRETEWHTVPIPVAGSGVPVIQVIAAGR